jgi:hypothetical protein
MSTRNKNTSKIVLIIIVLALIVVGIGMFLRKSNTGPRVMTFTVELADLGRPNFVATATGLDKIEVWAVPEATSTPKSDVKLGMMELVEGDAQGNQTWILATPEKPLIVKEIYTQGYIKGGGKASKVSLPYKGSAKLTPYVWPMPTQAVISGKIKAIGSKSLTMIIAHTASSTITISYAPKIVVVDATGKPMTLSKLKTGSDINVTGTYIDETAFSASQIEVSGS